jgi:predicted TIM-barrel fold metal-dependent hydrolase
MKSLIEQEQRIRRAPFPVIIDHIARVKPAEGLNQPGFQLLLELIKLKHVWTKVSGADKICETMVLSCR